MILEQIFGDLSELRFLGGGVADAAERGEAGEREQQRRRRRRLRGVGSAAVPSEEYLSNGINSICTLVS